MSFYMKESNGHKIFAVHENESLREFLLKNKELVKNKKVAEE